MLEPAEVIPPNKQTVIKEEITVPGIVNHNVLNGNLVTLTADEGANLLKFLCRVGQVNNTEKRYPLSIQLIDLLKYLSVHQRVGLITHL